MNDTIKSIKQTNSGRIDGLDFARFLAFFGMVFVNFKIVMLPLNEDLGASEWFFNLLEGRAAALFVILAGLGLGLSVKKIQLNETNSHKKFASSTIKRGLFLIVIGLLNSFVFSADILHYYGIYFLFAAFLVPLSDRILKLIIVGLLILSTIMLVTFDFDSGWDWKSYEYEGFYTVDGAITNLFYNGWHPVIPWLAFLLFGVILSRIKLTDKSVQLKLIFWGIVISIFGYLLSVGIISNLADTGDAQMSEIIPLFSMGPVPATLFYMITASATACCIIAISIILAKKYAQNAIVKAINTAGKQTLTLYIAHIYIGMGLIEVMGMLANSSAMTSIIYSTLFTLLMLIACNIWAKYFKTGPLETIMRKITG